MLAALLVAASVNAAHMIVTKHAPGCDSYTPVSGRMLIAHAAGGLPDRTYANSIEALDRAYAHGFRAFEMDFHRLPFGIVRAGHDASDLLDPREAWLSQVLGWLRRHPGTRLVVDMKTDNVRGLETIAADAPDLRTRITPMVYTRSQYRAVRAVGLSPPIYALFYNEDPDWLSFANSHAFAAVALPPRLFGDIAKVRHPVIVYTFDDMVNDPGSRAVITNCMVPRDARAADPAGILA